MQRVRYAALGAGLVGLSLLPSGATKAVFGNIKTISLLKPTQALAVSPSGRYAYVLYGPSSDTSTVGGIEVLDLSRSKLVANSPIAGNPTAVAASPNGAYLYVSRQCASKACPQSLAVVEARTWRVVWEIGVGGPSDYVNVSPDGRVAYVWADGALETVNLQDRRVVNRLSTYVTPIDAVLARNGLAMYAAVNESVRTSDGGRTSLKVRPGVYFLRLGSPSPAIVRSVPAPANALPCGIALSPSQSRVYESFCSYMSGKAQLSADQAPELSVSIRAIDARTGKVVGTFATNGDDGLVVSPDGRELYAVESTLGLVRVIDTATGRTVEQYRLPGLVTDLGIGDGAHYLVAASNGNGAVYLIPRKPNGRL